MKQKNNRFLFTLMVLLLGRTLCPGEEISKTSTHATTDGWGLHKLDFSPPGPEAKKELSVKRENIFEFTTPPRVTRAGDRVDIYFETKAFCDATVAIEDANGKIVRFLASGVLGNNAPAPFEKNLKKQHLVWDGKNDFGVFMDDKDALTVRVSLGLKASFEKTLHHYDVPDFCMTPVVHAGPEGVFVYNTTSSKTWDWLLQFDHDGNYVRTVHPFSANALDKIKGLNWVYAWPDDYKVPAKSFTGHGSLLPFVTSIYDAVPSVTDFTVRNGWISLLGCANFARLGTDGTTRGQDLTGGTTVLTSIKHGLEKSKARRSATSPDGKWIYLARAFGYGQGGPVDYGMGSDPSDQLGQMMSYMDHAVYRVPADGSVPPQVFAGDPKNWGSDNEHFNLPSGIAVDPQGRVYVSDWDNDRVQIFTPEGKFLKTIPVSGPADIVINQKTGEIYVFSWLLRPKVWFQDDPRFWHEEWSYNRRGYPARVKKFKPFDAGAGLIYEEKFMEEQLGKWENYTGKNTLPILGPGTRVELDCWAAQPTLWVFTPRLGVLGNQRLWMMKEENNKWKVCRDFWAEREKSGLKTQSRYSGLACVLLRQFLYFDPKHQVLYVAETDSGQVKYFSRMVAIDVATGHESIIQLPFMAADAAIDAKGRIYLLNDDKVGRFDLETWHEVPFDYGQEFGKDGKIVSTIKTIGGHYSSYKHQSLGVSPQGDVIVAGRKNLPERNRMNNIPLSYGLTPWMPVVYPGRPNGENCVNVFNIYGELVHEDALAGIEIVTGGLDMDWQGNIYAAETGARLLDKHPIQFNTGTLIKFPPKGGRFLTDGNGAMVPIDKLPEEPAPILGDGGHVWAEGAQWFFGGTPVGLFSLNCACVETRFKTDYFGRSFVPESRRYSVAVVDSAGNVIMRIGQYGNVDSAGPKSLVPLGGDEIGLFDPRFITMDTDKRVFIGDPANDRIVSGLLGYHVNQRLPLKDIRDEAKK
jgi:DNA-binding beta-propeller fold protein YncE